MSDNIISYGEYWTEITAIAKEASEMDSDSQDDFLHETVDSHMWVIYTYRNLQVLMHTDNRDAWTGIDSQLPANNWLTVAAYWAMLADVRDRLATMESEDAA
jgi:hypothetical protein